MIITITKANIEIEHDAEEQTITITTKERSATHKEGSEEYESLLNIYPELKGETK